MATNEEKNRRMELRKATGSRVIEPPKTPPYNNGPEYLVAHACFECRKSFKQPVSDSIEHICPECKERVYEMGRSFTAPKTSDTKQWKKVQGLYAAGFRFIGSGNHGSPPLPTKLSELERFLQDNPKHYLKVATPIKNLKLTSLRSAGRRKTRGAL